MFMLFMFIVKMRKNNLLFMLIEINIVQNILSSLALPQWIQNMIIVLCLFIDLCNMYPLGFWPCYGPVLTIADTPLQMWLLRVISQKR